MSAPEDGEAPAPPDGQPARFYMDKTEEVADAQERYRRASAPPDPGPAPAPATTAPDAVEAPVTAAAPVTAVAPVTAATPAPVTAPPAAVEPRALGLARLATAGAALTLAIAFFQPAAHDALDRDHPRVKVGRDGRALPPPPVPRMNLLVDATPRGATVTLDGADAGNTPLATNVACVDGAPIHVAIDAPGYAPYETTVACTPGGNAVVAPTLTRATGRR